MIETNLDRHHLEPQTKKIKNEHLSQLFIEYYQHYNRYQKKNLQTNNNSTNNNGNTNKLRAQKRTFVRVAISAWKGTKGKMEREIKKNLISIVELQRESKPKKQMILDAIIKQRQLLSGEENDYHHLFGFILE